MDIVKEITDFFARLVRSRVNGVQAQARSKMYDAQTRAKSRASQAFNNAVDRGVDSARDRATGRQGEDSSSSSS